MVLTTMPLLLILATNYLISTDIVKEEIAAEMQRVRAANAATRAAAGLPPRRGARAGQRRRRESSGGASCPKGCEGRTKEEKRAQGIDFCSIKLTFVTLICCASWFGFTVFRPSSQTVATPDNVHGSQNQIAITNSV